jgi:hypothetical protein
MDKFVTYIKSLSLTQKILGSLALLGVLTISLYIYIKKNSTVSSSQTDGKILTSPPSYTEETSTSKPSTPTPSESIPTPTTSKSSTPTPTTPTPTINPCSNFNPGSLTAECYAKIWKDVGCPTILSNNTTPSLSSQLNWANSSRLTLNEITNDARLWATTNSSVHRLGCYGTQ